MGVDAGSGEGIGILTYDKGPSFLCRGRGFYYIEGTSEYFHAMG